jgi:hypothetical protein
MDNTEDSMAVLECPVWYMNVMDESMALTGCRVGYISVTEGFSLSLSARWGT